MKENHTMYVPKSWRRGSFFAIYASIPLEGLLYHLHGATDTSGLFYLVLLAAACAVHELYADETLAIGSKLPHIPVRWIPFILILVMFGLAFAFLALGWSYVPAPP
jgi:hypothetical protein